MRTRLAPSPTGALHLGNARTFVITWLHVRKAGGSVVLRIDDLDTPRTKPGADQQALEELRWLGLDWDADEPVLRQTERTALYDETARALAERGLAYACVCTRREITEAASAPHGPAGPSYPRTCLGRFASLDEAERLSGRSAALRFSVPDHPVSFEDLLYGPQSVDLSADGGDFPILRRTGEAAYQLATVLDDDASGVDLVIRGADLLPSTARQILLLEALGLDIPGYLHLPLVVGRDRRRLAKRHGDTRLSALRAAGVTVERVLGWIAATLGLAPEGASTSLAELLERYDPRSLGTDPIELGSGEFPGGAPAP